MCVGGLDPSARVVPPAPWLKFSATCFQPSGPLPGLQLHLPVPVPLLLPSTWYGDWMCQQVRTVFHLYTSPPIGYGGRQGDGQCGAGALLHLGWGKEEAIPDQAGGTLACLEGDSVGASC